MLECRIFIVTRQSLFLTLFVVNFIRLWHHSCPTFTEQEKLEKIPGKNSMIHFCSYYFFFPFQANRIFNCLIYTWQESQCPLWIFTLLNICLNIFQLVTEASDVWSQSNSNPKTAALSHWLLKNKRSTCFHAPLSSPSDQTWTQHTFYDTVRFFFMAHYSPTTE